MKIKRIEYKNFKCYPKLIIPQNERESFPNGLLLIQGNTPIKSNSFGKTSLVEGILLGFFGPGALKPSINKLITFGKQKGEIKIIFEVDGKDYLINRILTRSRKSGTQTSKFYVRDNGTWKPDDTLKIEELLDDDEIRWKPKDG